MIVRLDRFKGFVMVGPHSQHVIGTKFDARNVEVQLLARTSDPYRGDPTWTGVARSAS